MAVTVTSLTHPTMIAKIRKGLYYAHKGQGHMMQGHGNRVYIQNARGQNIMRLNWIGGRQGYIVYGQESRDVTDTVKAALKIAKVRDYAIAYNGVPVRSGTLPRTVAVSGLALLLTGCQSHGAVSAMVQVLSGLLT